MRASHAHPFDPTMILSAVSISVSADAGSFPSEFRGRIPWGIPGTQYETPTLDLRIECCVPRTPRAATAQGVRLPTWKEVESRQYHDWTVERIVLDTSRGPEGECLDELLSKLLGEAA